MRQHAGRINYILTGGGSARIARPSTRTQRVREGLAAASMHAAVACPAAAKLAAAESADRRSAVAMSLR